MDSINKTLAEQLSIGSSEIHYRKELLGLTEEDTRLLAQCKDLITPHLETIVNEFYKIQTSFHEISLLIGDAETLQRLRGAMRRYILDLFSGSYDEEYLNKRLRISKVHHRIGVSTKLYLAAMFHLQQILHRVIEEHYLEQKQMEKATDVKQALDKIIIFDTQLVFDTYIFSLMTRVESAQKQLEEYVENLEEIIRERTRQLKEASLRDMLTGLFNQRAFYEHLRREMTVAERYNEPIALCFFDMDGFKQVNDNRGHKYGDNILSCLGECMLQAVRETDYACRYGGDEFAIILPRSGVVDATRVVKRVVSCFKDKCLDEVTFSIGINSTGPDEFVDMDSFIKHADQMMYQSKAKAVGSPGFHISKS